MELQVFNNTEFGSVRTAKEAFLQSHAHRTRNYLRKDIWCK